MNTLLAIFLGVVQGLTEFIPISSSAHLAILHKILQPDETSKLLFDVLLHLGTLVALLAYFWREWYELFKNDMALRKLSDHKTPEYKALKEKSMPLWPIIIASIPAAVTGALLEKKVEAVLDNSAIIACTMIAFGLVLYASDRLSKGKKEMRKATLKDWMLIGCAQALAIIPGVSRSGSTISAGLLCGFRREAAARFSFLLGAPIMLGAAIFELRHIKNLTAQDIIPFVMGLAASALVGYISIGYLIEYLKRRGTTIFVLYRVLFGVIVLTAYAFGQLR